MLSRQHHHVAWGQGAEATPAPTGGPGQSRKLCLHTPACLWNSAPNQPSTRPRAVTTHSPTDEQARTTQALWGNMLGVRLIKRGGPHPVGEGQKGSPGKAQDWEGWVKCMKGRGLGGPCWGQRQRPGPWQLWAQDSGAPDMQVRIRGCGGIKDKNSHGVAMMQSWVSKYQHFGSDQAPHEFTCHHHH